MVHRKRIIRMRLQRQLKLVNRLVVLLVVEIVEAQPCVVVIWMKMKDLLRTMPLIGRNRGTSGNRT